MKETNRTLLEELILAERSWSDPAVIRAIAEDPDFAKAAHSAAETLGVLKRNSAGLDDVEIEKIPTTEAHRTAAQEGLVPRSRSPILRHSLWLIPSAAAVVLVFSQMQKDPSPSPSPNNATLGGAQDRTALPQANNQFAMFDLGDSMRDGETAKILVYASDMEAKNLFKSGRIELPQYHLTPDQLGKLAGYEKVWIVVEFEHRAGHTRSLAGQYWIR